MKKPIKPNKFNLPEPKQPKKPNEFLSFYAYKPNPWWHDEYEVPMDKEEFFNLIEDGEIHIETLGCDEGELFKLKDDPSKSYKDVEEFITESGEYQPSYSSNNVVSLETVLNNIPEKHKNRALNISFYADSYHLYDNEYTISIWASYNIPNENFEKEQVEFEENYAKYEKELKEWKRAEKRHKSENKKYTAEMKKYKNWLAEKIEELENSE